jgi:RNA polymerase sigma factor (sigma-70 family)
MSCGPGSSGWPAPDVTPEFSGLVDADRVAAIRAGDPAAWGHVFDRYRDAVYRVAWSITRNAADAEDVVSSTFLRGVESISQLRQPDHLNPWLLSIARRESLGRVPRGRAREVAAVPSAAWQDPIGDGSEDPTTGLPRAEAVRLAQAAFDALDAKDRATLELSDRQELTGDELNETLGVTADRAHAMVSHAQARFELTISLLVVARVGREDCPELDRILHDWDGALGPLVEKRVAGHVKGCHTCESTAREWVRPAALLGLLPVVTIPTTAAERSKAVVMRAAGASTGKLAAKAARTAAGGFSGKAAIVAALALATLIGGTAFVAAGNVGSGRGGPNDDQADQDVVVAATTTQPVTATTGPCEAARALVDFVSPGPVSSSEADVGAYLATTNHLVHLVAEAYGPIATDELLAYAAHHQRIVDAGIRDLGEIPDAFELAELATVVERQLAADCDLEG